jgi:hypothetical protein
LKNKSDVVKEDNYQIETKAHYINLLLLGNELNHFDSILITPLTDLQGWNDKLFAVRGVFLTLYNINDLTNKLGIKEPKEYITQTRKLRKKLEFANHFRNKGIGHLDSTLLKRAVQWNPLMFVETGNESELLKTTDAQRAVIESCINSFLDQDGRQRVFGHEIVLNDTNDNKVFFEYLKRLVVETMSWVGAAKNILDKVIYYHSKEEILELASVAAQTNFNLKEKTDIEYIEKEAKENLGKGLKVLGEQGVDPKLIKQIKHKYKI